MTTERQVCDLDVRTRVTTDLGTTFLLEAGAGTGKTRVLVDRYVRCVLDPSRGTGDVRTVAAITFTEKAAGELRQRVREEFEKLALAARPEQRTTIQAALDALDDAPISTIHGFCGRLLREFPVEAGVDPAFEQLDALGSDLELARLWEEWLADVAAADPVATPERRDLSRLLRAGVRLEWLRELAAGAKGVFGERYDLETPPTPVEPDLAGDLTELGRLLERLGEHCAAACTNPSDRGLDAAMRLVEAGRGLVRRPPADADQAAASLFGLPAKENATAPGGAKANWIQAAGGKEELQTRYRAAVAEVVRLREVYATYVTGLAVSVAAAFSAWASDAQAALGRLDFTDLLGRLRDLLRDDSAARALLQSRFSYVLVDEFQDTDPLQAEIVFYLCEQTPRAGAWGDVVLAPGKLFIVGDPKQSIYRFRRADIGMYDQVKRLVAGQPGGTGAVEVIRQNFRTTPAAVGWINNVFAGVFDDDREEGRQPGYEWVEAYRPDADGARVTIVRGDEYGTAAGAADAARRDEAAALAALLLGMMGGDGEEWRVQDRDAGGHGEAWRRPRWGDVALLFRATTGLETYEQALREAGVPYRVEGGRAYFLRREVDDALLCLRAIDDPADGPAVYGALHSSILGFSDDELFRFWAAGGRFDPFAGQPDGHAEIGAALALLRELHGLRTTLEPHELAAELVRTTRTVEFLAGTGAGAAQAVANVEKLLERARAFSGAGGGGLGAFLAWAAEAGEAAGEQESQVDDAGDVVRLLTIHKAKGLEYPIVVLVGGGQAGGGRGGGPIVDREKRSLAVKLRAELPGAPARDLVTQAYTALAEREKSMDVSEQRRLLYVAATRARDHLVLSCFGHLRNKDGSPAAVLLGPVIDVLPELKGSGEGFVDGGVRVMPPGRLPGRSDTDEASGGDAVGLRETWRAARDELLARACRPASATSPSGLEHVDEDVRSGGPGAPPGRAAALALGSAVHRTLEVCDLDDEVSVAAAATEAARDAGRPDLAGKTAELALACWRSAPVRAAARAAAADAGAVFREVPIGALIDGVVLRGAVDLLYRDGDAWVVVDYKTDRAGEPNDLLERYASQGAAYAVAVERATGDVVREVAFVAASAGGREVRVAVDDALRARVAGEVGAAAGEGRALRPDELSAV